MGTKQELKVFGDKQIRTYWDDVQERWFFCIADVVEAITDSSDVRQYIKRLRQRDAELGAVWGTICTPPPINFAQRMGNYIPYIVHRWKVYFASFNQLLQRKPNPSNAGLPRLELDGSDSEE